MTFNDIKGQQYAIALLKESIKAGLVAGSYLFSGPQGIGKRACARIFAKVLNCDTQSSIDSCDKCASCVRIEKEQHPDVHFIDSHDGESVKIEYMHQLRREIQLRPYEARKKVFIVDNAEHLTAQAANALLKTLEEPPKDSVIILVSAKPALMFKTIVSRCQRVMFYPMPRQELASLLKKEHAAGEERAHFLAYYCEGRIGSALKLIDSDIVKEKNEIVDAFALMNEPLMNKLVIKERIHMRFSLQVLLAWYRDLYLLKSGVAHSELVNIDRTQDLLRLMPQFTFAGLDEITGTISRSALYLQQNVNLKLLTSHVRAGLWSR